MKIKITLDEAFEVSETLFGILKQTKPDDMKLYEVKALFMLKRMKTNNLKEIKEIISKDFYHVPKHILEVKIAKTIKKLSDKGLISKEKCPKDRRQAILKITVKGEEFLKKTQATAKRKWEEAVNG